MQTIPFNSIIFVPDGEFGINGCYIIYGWVRLVRSILGGFANNLLTLIVLICPTNLEYLITCLMYN